MSPGAVEAEPLALAHHLNLYAREAFADFSREFIHDKVLMHVAAMIMIHSRFEIRIQRHFLAAS